MNDFLIEKRADMVMLKDFYDSLLTAKQRRALELFYEDDLSLIELGEQCNCSRQAAFDLLKRTTALLSDYEQKLHLLAQYRKRQDLKEQIETCLIEAGLEQNTNQKLWQLCTEIGE